MRRFAICCVLLLLAGTTAHAERTCDLEDRAYDEKLQEDETVTISGHIIDRRDPDSGGNYSYEVQDSCGSAIIGWNRPIACNGTISVTGRYKGVDVEAMALAIWVTRFNCR